jgi:cation/acetate symporter
MIHEASTIAVVAFLFFVGLTLALSFYLGKKAKSSAGYFAAHGEIPWFINGVAFAGDYLSAASFLGICGMIAFYGYDGFLYSIGYLAGWIVALFVVAEPMKRLGKYTFADALDAKFHSRGVKLAAAVSTLVVSIFYLIPQMVGAGALITPLFAFEHWVGVVIVGTTVILIVVMAGMVSTTYVQFIKGGLLVLFSFILTVMILNRGFTVQQGGSDGYQFRALGPYVADNLEAGIAKDLAGATVVPPTEDWVTSDFLRTQVPGSQTVTVWLKKTIADKQIMLYEGQMIEDRLGADGKLVMFINGQQREKGKNELHPIGYVSKLPEGKTSTGPIGPLKFFSVLNDSEVVLSRQATLKDAAGQKTDVYFSKPTSGREILRPGETSTFKGIRSDKWSDKLNFLSLMLALFCGTASLPHILIRYYTVKDGASARKSTIVGIASIGFFYVLTLFMGLGAMTSGALDPTDTNMAAPLLAKSMSEPLFAIISAIAFTTVLGTVSGLILASSGAVAHDLVANVLRIEMTDVQQVRVAKISSVVVGAIAIVLGIIFKNYNVNFLVGWAFSVAASANLPALIMILFWKRTTRQGVIASILAGMFGSLTWILLSGTSFKNLYGFTGEQAEGIVPFDQPGIVTIPLGFLVLVAVSLLTKPNERDAAE